MKININQIILIISFIAISFLLIFIFIFVIIKKNKKVKKSIFYCLELDTKRWIIKRSNSLLNNIIYDEKFNNYFNSKVGKGWVSINNLFKILNENDVYKWKKAIEFCIQNESNSWIEHEINFKHIEKNKTISYYIGVKFSYINDKTINIEFKSKERLNDKYLIDKIIDRNKLFNDNNKYKLFIAFYIEEDFNEVFISFIKEIKKIINIKNFYFFKSNSIIIMFTSNNHYKKLVQDKKKLQKKLFKSKNNKSNINNFYTGSAFVECEDQINDVNFSKIMTRISFSLVKSKVTGDAIHFNLKNIVFNEFEEFKEIIMDFHNKIESKFEYNKISISSIRSNRNVSYLYLPKFQINDYFWNKYIIKMNEFDQKIREKFTNEILFDKEVINNKKVMIIVNDYQVEKIFELMKERKNVIFIINQIKYKNIVDFINLLKLLELSNIKYGLCLDEINSKTISIIANIKPKLIILSEKFNESFNQDDINNKLKLINAIVITERLGIMLLFTNLNKIEKEEVLLLSKKDKLFVNVPSINLI